ncbi:LuxR family transcriptional regulator [Catenulispora rubra]|uniref:LuxR family transcriptional regulator n=1 Tax=Catenulispora rubra TaxID=280293 RepID=UPI0018927868|nr:LuxR family transcriptional regulator [Catenulispora rubra]
MVIERDAERAAIDELLAAAHERRSGALCVRGPAGIGKTALLEYTLEQPGWARILRADGIEAERDLPYAGLNLLMRPLLGYLDVLPERQRAALGSVFGTGGIDHPDSRFLLGLAVLSLLAAAAEDGPLLCLLDDAHWFDDASMQALYFAARRLDAEGIVLLIATRDDDPRECSVRIIDVGPLSEQGAASLLARHRPDLAGAARLRVLKASAGNPLALLELQPQEADMPLTRRLRSAFEERLRVLPDKTRLLLLIAAADGTGDLGVVLRASGAALADLEIAEHAGLITLTGTGIAFGQPIVHAAVYQSAPLSARIAAHTALAAALTDPGDRDRCAWHRAKAATGLDDRVAAELEDTARRARERGGYEAAAAAYSQAARLSSVLVDKARRLTLAGEMASETARLDDARAAAEQAARLPSEPELRARIARVRATADFKQGRPRSAHALLTEGAVHIAGTDPHQELRMHLTAANAAWSVGDPELLAVTNERLSALRLPERDPMASVHRFLVWMTALAAGWSTADMPPPGQTIAEARQASVRCPYDLSFIAVGGLVAGQERPTRDVVAAMAEESRLSGRIGWLVAMLCLQSSCELLLGEHKAARSCAAEALDLARDVGLGKWLRHAVGTLAYLAAVEGDEAGCLEAAGEALGSPVTEHTMPGNSWPQWALAVQDLAAGRADSAVRRLDFRAYGVGSFDTPAIHSVPDVVEALVRLDRHDDAIPATKRLELWAAQIRQPSVDALVNRCKALISEKPEHLYLEALELHRTDSRPFEHARTELLYGEWLRRVRRKADARTHLSAALGAFESLGARPWADRAATELEATKPRRTPESIAAGGLTAQESKITGLAAEGLSDKEIAARLFLSPRTVGYHLNKAYRKLGVLSRKELIKGGEQS